jgi:hypothetical protein
MMNPAKIFVLDGFDNLPHASIQNRVLMYLHVERAPTGIIDAPVVPGADAKEGELALQHSMVQHTAHEVIAILQPKPDVFGFPNDARNCSLKSRSEPFVSVKEQNPFGFEGKGLPIGNSEPSHPRLGYIYRSVGARRINHHDFSEAIECGEALLVSSPLHS